MNMQVPQMKTEDLVSKSVHILKEVKAGFKNPVILWSTGKDSTLSLSLCKEAFDGTVPFPVLYVDTGLQFKQMSDFRDKVAKDWNLNLVVEKSDKAEKISPSQETRNQTCCQTLKRDAVNCAIEKHGFDALLLSICRNKQPIRNMEQVWTQKKKTGTPSDSLQVDPVFNLQTDFGGSRCTRINPILHWDEIAIWEYTQQIGAPVNPLYFAKQGVRRRSLDCRPCSNSVKSSAKNVDEIIEELTVAKGPEKSQEAEDKEKIMQKLKDMGYM
jgi:sulfate adenylyltransferase subunit 2